MSLDNPNETKIDKNSYFKWYVLLNYVVIYAGLSMAELLFATIPKQTAAYYGVTGKYFEI